MKPSLSSTPSPARVRGAACVLAALLAGALALAASAPDASAGNVKAGPYLANGFDGIQVRPTSMTLLGPAQVLLVKLKWQRWGGKKAVARGKWGRHDCRTGCGSGPLVEVSPVRVVLKKRRRCAENIFVSEPARYYRKRTITFTDSVPKGMPRRMVARFSCPPKPDETIRRSPKPLAVRGLDAGVAAVSAGDGSACALTIAGTVKCWGHNGDGQLGSGHTKRNIFAPVDVRGLDSGVTAISTSGNHGCALTDAGAVKCWGLNDSGQLGDGSTKSRPTPVAVKGLDGDVSAISAGLWHTCALMAVGTVKCWGQNEDEFGLDEGGQLGDGTGESSSTPVQVTGLEDVVAVSAGSYFTCALTSAGAVSCWGQNPDGQLGNGTRSGSNAPVEVSGLGSGVSSIAAGNYWACAVMTTGSAKCWGGNDVGQLGNGTTSERSTVPVDVVGLDGDAAALSAGLFNTCALTTAGAVKCWGENDEAQLGNTSGRPSSTPMQVRGLKSGATGLSVGSSFACAVTGGAGAKCWGTNWLGELGVGRK